MRGQSVRSSASMRLFASDRELPMMTAPSGTQRARDLLIRSSMCGHSDPFRSVRDLGRVPFRCSWPSGIPGVRSPRRLPAWLPVAEDLAVRLACCGPSVFQAGHKPSWRGLCERPALSPVAAVSCWSLLLLSPLLSAAANPQPPALLRSAGPWAAVTSLPEPSLPRGRYRRSAREPARAAGGNAFALLRRCAGGRDRPQEAALPDRPVAGAGMPDRPRQALAAAAAARRNAPHDARRPYALHIWPK